MSEPTFTPAPAASPQAPGRAERGQSLVEFALLGMFLVVLLMGVLDLGRLYYTYLALKDAAGEGAYYASAFPRCANAASATLFPGCGGANNVDYRMRNSSPIGSLIDWNGSNTIITTTQPIPLLAGSQITVAVSYEYQMITPIVGALAPNNRLILSAESSAIIVRIPNCAVSPCR